MAATTMEAAEPMSGEQAGGELVVELTRPDPADIHLRVVVAVVHVHADRTWDITGDAGQVPIDLTVYDPERQRWIGLAEDPLTWGKRLYTELRTPYLTARAKQVDD